MAHSVGGSWYITFVVDHVFLLVPENDNAVTVRENLLE
jgi:hypothetical protein